MRRGGCSVRIACCALVGGGGFVSIDIDIEG